MKHIKALLVIVTIFSFLSFQSNESVVGKWELFKMENSDGEVRETSGRWMDFQADGVLKGGNTFDTTNRTGNWEYNKETKELSISSEKKRPGEGTFKINWIDNKTISLTVGPGRKVYLKRME
ncbi:glycoside hydrolase family 43 C-terminal domain-containing protein [uncultured Kordia sp.]|uniref:lipocalin-like domain-containing protein n=1 Tax=uncultured Kordia sp. TaxID=507699 RepID=UPI00260BC977|nr:glycoside hydrolase family 43 C-terminal domain-containing protein [uncultured Kordia sp.]